MDQFVSRVVLDLLCRREYTKVNGSANNWTENHFLKCSLSASKQTLVWSHFWFEPTTGKACLFGLHEPLLLDIMVKMIPSEFLTLLQHALNIWSKVFCLAMLLAVGCGSGGTEYLISFSLQQHSKIQNTASWNLGCMSWSRLSKSCSSFKSTNAHEGCAACMSSKVCFSGSVTCPIPFIFVQWEQSSLAWLYLWIIICLQERKKCKSKPHQTSKPNKVHFESGPKLVCVNTPLDSGSLESHEEPLFA